MVALDPAVRGENEDAEPDGEHRAVPGDRVIATLGAPLDVTAANLAIETFLPMDAESAARLGALNAARSA